MKYWNLDSRLVNPPKAFGISEKLEYLRTFVQHTAYIPGHGETETARTYKRRIYVTLRALSIAESPPQRMRVESK